MSAFPDDSEAGVPVIRVDDPRDPRIAGYRDIREADLVGRQGGFIAEGEVVLRQLLSQGRHAPVSILVAEKRLQRLAALLERVGPETPIFAASQAVMDEIVGFPIHRGILALARRAPEADARDLLATLPPHALILCLFGIANHDNMGGLFRNAAAFGVGAVLIDATCCDPLYRKAIRVSVGGVLVTPFARLPADEDPIDLLRALGFEALALSPQGRTRLIDQPAVSRAALLLGGEGPGLPADLLARCHTLSIPMSAGFDSLNVATTSGIALHHLEFAARAPGR